ncbi:nuclear transport factor 2 family protein [Zunongwangia profunda]
MLGFNYYDYLSLFKINGEWKIVNKLFTNVVL